MLMILVKKSENIFINSNNNIIIIPLGLCNHKIILRNNTKMDFTKSKI